MSRDSFYCILDLIGDHSVFHNNSPKPQAAVFVQLAVALDRFGHEGNGACLDRSMLLWGISHGSMVNYTNRVMIALESCMGHEIAWPDRQGRASIAEHFAALGFPGCVGLVDGTLVKLSQRPRDDGETYFDQKSNYSLNVQVICDQHKRVIYFFAGMPGSCHDLTCLRRSGLWRRLDSAQLFDRGQYLLGDSGYVPLERLVCSYKRTGGDMDKVSFNTCIAHARVGNEHCIGILKARLHSLKEIRTQLRNARENAYVIRWIRCCIILHNFLIWRNDEWSDEDHPIELERDADIRPPPEGIRDVNRRGIQRRQEVQALCLEINRRPGGLLSR
ncbi:hypothetical protein R1sor_003341 [Riccia sorocarpa]|uniref:DDE Tnp4 domain-containing protein n=1 Tax=Riccia sorocarpa TaxID=122646 RepID=A0ABD3H453_9MARC